MSRLREKLLQVVPPMQHMPSVSHINIVLLNVRSLVAKLVDIKADLELHNANVLCFCETWLSPEEATPLLNPEHVALRCDREVNDHKGGTMISVPHAMQPSRLVPSVCNGIECVVTILCVNHKRLQIALVYRSPSVPLRVFVQFMTRLLDHLSVADTATVVLGDVNNDVLSASGSAVERFMLSHGYTQLVRHATTDRATLIDHVYFNRQCDEVCVQVRDVYYSDHDAVYCSVPLYLL